VAHIHLSLEKRRSERWCRPPTVIAERLLQSQISLQQLRVSCRIGPGQDH